MLKIIIKLWKECQDENKYKMWEVCCHTDFMPNIYESLKVANINSVKEISFLSHLSSSPYALSISFLKDISLVGKQDEYGRASLNLNE